MENMILAFFEAVSSQLYIVLAALLIDFLLGVVMALVRKEFEWDKLIDYIKNGLLPVFGWLVSAFVVFAAPDLFPELAPDAVYATIMAAFSASILSHLRSMGVLPDSVGRLGIVKKG